MDNKLQRGEQAELERLEAVVDEAVGAMDRASAAFTDAMVQAKVALVAIKDQKLYRATHPSFERYMVDRWDRSLRTAKRWIEQGRWTIAMEAESGRAPSFDEVPSQRALARAKKPAPIDVPSMRTHRGQGIIESEASHQGEGEDRVSQKGSSGQPAAGSGAVATTREVAEAAQEPEPDHTEQGTAAARGIRTAGTPEQAAPSSLQAAYARLLMSDPEELRTLGRDRLAELMAKLRPLIVRSLPAPGPAKSDCKHPVGRRIGGVCMACGESTKAARP